MRTCRECGCGDLSACVYDDGHGTRFTCFWADEDLCSFCALLYTAAEQIPVRGVDSVLVSGGVL